LPSQAAGFHRSHEARYTRFLRTRCGVASCCLPPASQLLFAVSCRSRVSRRGGPSPRPEEPRKTNTLATTCHQGRNATPNPRPPIFRIARFLSQRQHPKVELDSCWRSELPKLSFCRREKRRSATAYLAVQESPHRSDECPFPFPR